MSRRHLSLASALAIFAGGLLLTAPASASAAAFACRDSVEGYCQWVADNYCTNGAVCTYTTSPSCQILDAECF